MELALVLGLVALATFYLLRRARRRLGPGGSGGSGGGCCGAEKSGCGTSKAPASASLPPGEGGR